MLYVPYYLTVVVMLVLTWFYFPLIYFFILLWTTMVTNTAMIAVARYVRRVREERAQPLRVLLDDVVK